MRPRLNRHVISTLILVLASSVAVPGAQWPIGQIRELLDRTSLHRLIDRDPPVTTGLDDALTGIDFLDRYKPSRFAPLRAQPQDADGGFRVGPGAYDFVAESYCLHAGTHGPGGGDGYMSAPLLGSRGDVVRHILQNAVTHPEIPQQDIQSTAVGHPRTHAERRHATQDSADGRTAADTPAAARSRRRSARPAPRPGVARGHPIPSTCSAPGVQSRGAFSADARSS